MSIDNQQDKAFTPVLKLDFNERSDKNSLIESGLRFEDELWNYPNRQELELILANQSGLNLDQILCTNGGDEAIYILMRILSESSQKTKTEVFKPILPLPAFSQYVWGIESWNLDAIQIPSRANLSIDIEAVLNEIEIQEKSVIILTRPNNPTGEFIELASLESVIKAAKKKKSWVFLDEAYIEFSGESATSILLLDKYSNLVILRTLSKAYGLAGIRFGYLMGEASLIAEFSKRCMPFNISSPSLAVAKKALNPSNQNEVESYSRIIIKNRELLTEKLASIGCSVFKSEGNFILLKLPPKKALAVASFAKKNDILLKTFSEKALGQYLRIAIPFSVERLVSFLEHALAPILICLDMDGVLIDTSGSYDETVKQTIKHFSGELVSDETIISLRFSGGFNNDWRLSQALLKQLEVNVSLEEVTDVFQSIYLGNIEQCTGSMKKSEGLVENEKPLVNAKLTANIANSNKQNFCIVTGRPRKEARAGQKLIGLETLDLISLDDVLKAKPSPEGIKKLQQKYCSSPQNSNLFQYTSSWMCGDNPDDMQAAVASNSLAIGIGAKNQNALYAAGADIVLDSINELEEWIR